MIRLLFSLFLLLAACGADGPPEPHERGNRVSISGDAKIGVRGGL